MELSMEKDSINFQMELPMMDTSKTISFKVKEHSLYQKDSIGVLSIKEKWRAEVFLLGKMVQGMKVIIKTIGNMVKASISLLMEKNMKEIGKKEYAKAKVL
jgi:hypothetical protein